MYMFDQHKKRSAFHLCYAYSSSTMLLSLLTSIGRQTFFADVKEVEELQAVTWGFYYICSIWTTIYCNTVRAANALLMQRLFITYSSFGVRLFIPRYAQLSGTVITQNEPLIVILT